MQKQNLSPSSQQTLSTYDTPSSLQGPVGQGSEGSKLLQQTNQRLTIEAEAEADLVEQVTSKGQ